MSKTWLLLRKRSSALLFAALLPLVAEGQLAVGVERPVSVPTLETLFRVSRIDAAASGENVLIVWVDRRTDRGSEIVATRLDRFGALRDPAGFPITSTPGVSEEEPMVEAVGTNFIVLWAAGGNTMAAEINGSGVITRGPLVLAQGRPDSLIQMERDLAVAISDASGTTISLLRADLTMAELRFIPRRQNVELARLGSGLLVTWTDFEFPSSLSSVRAMRLDNRARIIDTTTVSALGTFDRVPTVVLKTIGNDVIIAASGGNKLAVARMLPDGTATLLYSVDDQSPRRVEDIVFRGDGFDVLATVAERARVLRFTGDALVSEDVPVPGAAFDGAGAITIGRVYTVWQVEGTVVGRFAFAGQQEFPLAISKTYASQQLPGLATDGANVLAVWSEDIDETRDRIVARRLTADGAIDAASQPVTLATRTLNALLSAPVVSFTGGNYAVAWLDQRRGLDRPANLILESVSRSGAPGLEVTVATTAYAPESPAIAGDLLVWTDRPIVDSQVRAALVSDPSRKVDIPDTVADPAVTLGNGAYVVVGTTTRGTVRGTMVSTSGAIQRTLFETIPPGLTADSQAAVAWNGRTNYLVVFRRNTAIHARLLDRDGNPVGTDFQLFADGLAERPRVAWDGYGFVVTWTVRTADVLQADGDVYGLRVLANGTVEGPPSVISASPRNDDFPTLLGLGFGRTLVAYQRMAGELQNVHRINTRLLVTQPLTVRRRSVR